MRKTILLVTTIVVASSSAVAWAVAADAGPGSGTHARHAPSGHVHPGHMDARRANVAPTAGGLAASVANARLATAKYVTNLTAAKAAGYSIITKMIPDMGWHFLNRKITGFDLAKPPILVYEKRGSAWQLGALEWVFPKRSRRPRRFPAPSTARSPPRATTPTARSSRPRRRRVRNNRPGVRREVHVLAPEPRHAARLALVPEPDGLYASMNPLVHPFNAADQPPSPRR